MRSPTVFYDRLQDSLSVDWLSEELVLIVDQWGYRYGLGWFGQLEGDGHFEMWVCSHTGSELYRTTCGRDPAICRYLVEHLAGMHTNATPKALRSA